MLHILKYNFLEDTFNYIGVHQDRMHQVISINNVYDQQSKCYNTMTSTGVIWSPYIASLLN